HRKSWPHFRPSAVDFCGSRLTIGAATERARALAMPAGTRAPALQTRPWRRRARFTAGRLPPSRRLRARCKPMDLRTSSPADERRTWSWPIWAPSRSTEKKLAAFSALGGRFLQFPIGDRRCNRTRASVGNAGGNARPSLTNATLAAAGLLFAGAVSGGLVAGVGGRAPAGGGGPPPAPPPARLLS